MRLVCRECSAAYEAPDSLFGPQPREVRCNRCGYQWTVVGPASPGDVRAPVPMPAPAVPSPAPLPEAEPVTATLLPADTERLADTLAVRPAPVLRVEPAAASTRALLGDIPAEAADIEMPDAEERRLSHELSFGETERHPAPITRSGGGGRGLWPVILIVIVLVIGAILFKPQLIDAVPALGSIYASVGL